jgi:membrane associated rhomboid family serine protease
MRNSQFSPMTGIPITPVVRWIVIISLVVWFVFQVLLEGYGRFPFSSIFGLVPGRVILDYYVWQVFTYIFTHSIQVTHILFNMLTLWFLGSELESKWGTKYFLFYYVGSGVGAGLLYILGVWVFYLATGNAQGLIVPVVGASGAIYGLMVAYAIFFGERTIHFMMLFPMKAKFFVLILGSVQLLSLLTAGITNSGEVAYLAHLGGIVSGYLIIKGTQFWNNRHQSGRGAKRKLKLVVNNDTPRPPRYWN